MVRFFALLSLLLFSACSVQQPLVVYGKKPAPEQVANDASKLKLTLTATTPTSALFTWQWAQGANTPDIAGFKLSVGVVPQTYTRVFDIADKNARSFTVTGLDLTGFNYAIIQSYTDFGLYSVATNELVFGGTPTPPFQLKASPAN